MYLFLSYQQTPIVLMHGSDDNKTSMENIKLWLEQTIPNVYIKNCEVGNGYNDSIYMPMNDQIHELATCIQNDKILSLGFYGIGYSLGGYLMRGYLQMYNQPRLKRLITFAAPHGGQFCGKTHKCGEILSKMTAEEIYSEKIQNSLAESACWRDPFNMDLFTEKSTSLNYLDNVKDFNQTYKDNFISLELLVLYGSSKDKIIWPWNSAWFGSYLPFNDQNMFDMTVREEYISDLFGLKTLHEQGKIVRIDSKTKHEDYPKAEKLIKQSVSKYLKD
uniref:Palmitoyl-protein thioesterase n=1 Tax=Trepomonas sp. PC1 TaxID=1076344 RepID=A0A146KCZ8_9EUKA|eukprot:JAP93794.1 Palmitoyl-protein thioesterase [Trepomonas sp. PC1]